MKKGIISENGKKMAIVFQYGSNCLEKEINSTNRLNGAAKFIGIAKTIENYKLVFDVYSKNRGCAASDIIKSGNKPVWGVLYYVPNKLLCKKTAPSGTKSFDEIEGEDTNYRRHWLPVCCPDGEQFIALTYVVKKPKKPKKKTSLEYVTMIIKGLREHKVPEGYIKEVKKIVAKHSPRLTKKIQNL